MTTLLGSWLFTLVKVRLWSTVWFSIGWKLLFTGKTTKPLRSMTYAARVLGLMLGFLFRLLLKSRGLWLKE